MSVSLRCYSTSLGCPKNRVDTERLLGSLGVALVPVESPDEAELVFINTCAFIQPATEESVRTIAQAIADIEEPAQASAAWRSPGVSWGVTTRKIWHLSCPKWISGWTTAIWRRGPPCSRASSAFPNPRFRAVS